MKHFKMLPSTNDYAKKWLQSDVLPPEGSIVLTDFQTNGKGQFDNQWHAEPNENLTFSLVYYPDFLSLERLFALNIVASLSILDALKKYTPHAMIKWPNDILIGSTKKKKVAGILIQNTLTGKKISASIIGIGFNVNQQEFRNLPQATSLSLSIQKKLDKNSLLNEVVDAFDIRFQQLKANEYVKLKKDYLSKLFLKDTISTFLRPNGTTFKGRITTVKDNGQLTIETNGQLVCFNFREVGFIF